MHPFNSTHTDNRNDYGRNWDDDYLIARFFVRRVVLYNGSGLPAFDRLVRQQIRHLRMQSPIDRDALIDETARRIVWLIRKTPIQATEGVSQFLTELTRQTGERLPSVG